MPPDDVQPFDLTRMFLGDISWLFTLEIVFRTCVIYLYTVFLTRWISKRVVGQLSLVEFLLVIALGSAVGDPMFYPEVPILHGVVVITFVVLINRALLFVVNSGEKLEEVIEGMPLLLVRNGVVQLDQLRAAMLNQEKLYEKLRTAQIEHLGQVEWAFLEQGGEITVFRMKETIAGLRIVPPWDLDEPDRIAEGLILESAERIACDECGRTIEVEANTVIPPCPNCQGKRWTIAVQPDS